MRCEAAAQLRRLRLEAGITQAQAARAAGIRAGTWRRYELGQTSPHPDRLAALARAIGAPLGALYDPAVIAELRLSPTTRDYLRNGGEPAIRHTAERLTEALIPLLRQAGAPPTANQKRKRAGHRSRLSPHRVRQHVGRSTAGLARRGLGLAD